MSFTRRHLLAAAALALITLLIFAQTRRFDFIPVDDPQYVTSNDRIITGLSWSNVAYAFTTMRMSNWHPLTWLSHMLDAELFGPGPAGPHLVNAIIHALNAAIAFAALLLLTGHAWRSAIVAALFALHPLRIESVAWIAERKDVLCAMFYLLAIAAYALYVKGGRGSRGPRGWYAAVIVAMALGALSKPSIVTLPCVLLLLDFWPLRRVERASRLVWEKLPLFALALASSAVTFVAQREGGSMSVQPPLTMRLANAALSFGRYVRKTLWPADLAAFYPYHGVVEGTRFPWEWAMVAAIAVAALTVIAIIARRREPAVLVGWLWFLGVLVPTIGIVQVGRQSMADRYTYLPHLGLFIALVWGIARLAEGSPALRKAAAALAFVAAGALAVSTTYQLRYWQNGYTLFTRALQVTHDNPAANMALAIWLTTNGRGQEALPHYEETLRLQPDIADAHLNYGNFLRERGDLEGALKRLQAAVELGPRHAVARHNLANVLGDLGRVPEAIAAYEEAIELDPHQAQFHYNLGVLLAGAGRVEEATLRFERALALRPGYVDARFMYALALLERGQVNAAKSQLEQVLSARPDWTDAMGRFAWVLATSAREQTRDPAAAVQLAHHANQLTSFNNPQLLDTLAAAYASAGRFDEAIAAATRAINIANARGQSALAGRIESRRKLYQWNRAFIAEPVKMPATSPATE